jgi:putative transposase
MPLRKKRRVSEFITDEALLKVGENYVWLWVAIEPIEMIVLGIRISFERTMLVAERFIQKLSTEYCKHLVRTDGGCTWHPQACEFLRLHHHLHSSFEKSIMERVIQYVKDRTNALMIIFLVEKISVD